MLHLSMTGWCSPVYDGLQCLYILISSLVFASAVNLLLAFILDLLFELNVNLLIVDPTY